MTIHEKLDNISSVLSASQNKEFDAIETSTVGSLSTTYTFVEDGYYIISGAGRHNSDSSSTGTISTTCEYKQLSSVNSFLCVWLVKGVSGISVKISFTGGGVSSGRITIIKCVL